MATPNFRTGLGTGYLLAISLGDKNRHVLNTVKLPHFTFVTDDSGASTVHQGFLKEHPTGHRPHSVEAPVVPLSSKCWVSPSWEVDDPLRLGSLDHSKDLNIQPLNIFLVSPSPNLGSTGYPKWGYNIKKIPPLPEQIGPCQEAPETSHPFFLYFMEHAQWHAVTCSDMRSLTRFLRGGAHRLKMSWVILSVPSSGLWFHPIEIAVVWSESFIFRRTHVFLTREIRWQWACHKMLIAKFPTLKVAEVWIYLDVKHRSRIGVYI